MEHSSNIPTEPGDGDVDMLSGSESRMRDGEQPTVIPESDNATSENPDNNAQW